MKQNFTDYEWDGELNGEDDIYLSAFLKPEEIFVASASVQNYQEETIEKRTDEEGEECAAAASADYIVDKGHERFFPDRRANHKKQRIIFVYEIDGAKRAVDMEIIVKKKDTKRKAPQSETKSVPK